jgi:hypothetical protein
MGSIVELDLHEIVWVFGGSAKKKSSANAKQQALSSNTVLNYLWDNREWVVPAALSVLGLGYVVVCEDGVFSENF